MATVDSTNVVNKMERAKEHDDKRASSGEENKNNDSCDEKEKTAANIEQEQELDLELDLGPEAEPEQKVTEVLQPGSILPSDSNGNTVESVQWPEKLKMEPIENRMVLLKSDVEYIEAVSQKYKARLTTFAHQPELVHRFVLGYNHEKPKKRMAITCEHLERYMETYERLKFNEIVSAPVSEDEIKVMKSWEIYIYGMDKMGHPIVYEKLGKMDLTTLQEVNTRNPTMIKLSKYRFMTKLSNLKSYLSNKYDKLIYKHVMILDMEGFNKRLINTTTRKLCKEIIGDLTQMYPELAHKVFVINAPSLFKNCWKVVKTFMEPVTVDKVKVFGTTEMQGFFKELNLIADAEMIPSFFGGKGTFTIRLSDIPSEFAMDLSKPYFYQLPQFSTKDDEKEKRTIKK